MNDEQMQIAIAEYNGWTKIESYRFYDDSGIDGIEPGKVIEEGFPEKFFRTELPNYLYDRDAIAEVIEKLVDDKPFSSNPGDYPTWMFSGHLLKMLGIKIWDNGTPLKAPFNLGWLIIKATPKQLAIAYLKAINLLDDDYEISND
jgi:hypothetical protein